MALFLAQVLATTEEDTALFPTRDLCCPAAHPHRAVPSEARDGHEDRTGRTWTVVAKVVPLRVSAQARASARERTLWNLGGARDGRCHRRASARADVGLERDVGALGAFTLVTEELALVLAARERLTADKRADVSASAVGGVVARGAADGHTTVDAT